MYELAWSWVRCRHTRDVLVEDRILLDYVVQEALAVFVHDEYLPLFEVC